MINRQKLIEDIENEFDGVCVYDVSGSTAAQDFIDIVYRQPPADVSDTNVGKWIPCSERLPKIGQKCNITIHRNCVYLVVSAIYWAGFWWRNGEKIIKKDVTAWMPLPEPYKGVE